MDFSFFSCDEFSKKEKKTIKTIEIKKSATSDCGSAAYANDNAGSIGMTIKSNDAYVLALVPVVVVVAAVTIVAIQCW